MIPPILTGKVFSSIETFMCHFTPEVRGNLKVVFTNGCFDLLHPGHIDSLLAAKALGDYLIVGLNSDKSIHSLKNKSRPIQDEESRAILLSALECTDAIILFEDDTPIDLIHKIKPEILVKGGDYAIADFIGADFVTSYAGKVIPVPYRKGHSTSELIQRIKEI